VCWVGRLLKENWQLKFQERRHKATEDQVQVIDSHIQVQVIGSHIAVAVVDIVVEVIVTVKQLVKSCPAHPVINIGIMVVCSTD